MDVNSNIKLRIKRLQEINNPDLMRYELYAIMTTLLLSKEEFKKNKEIEDFLNLIGINFKGYVIKSRTLTVARVLRIVEKSDFKNLENYKVFLKEFYLKDTYGENSKSKEANQNRENYMNDLLKKYSRNKR